MTLVPAPFRTNSVTEHVARIVSERGYNLPVKSIMHDLTITLLGWPNLPAMSHTMNTKPQQFVETIADAIMRTADADALAPAMTASTGPDYTSAITNALRDLIHSEKD